MADLRSFYKDAWVANPVDEVPKSYMVEDGRAAMELIEDACDIWALRKAPTKDAWDEK